jgi:Tol biopolymer transport system component
VLALYVFFRYIRRILFQQGKVPDQTQKCGSLSFCAKRRFVSNGTRTTLLTQREADLLSCLIERRNTFLPSATLVSLARLGKIKTPETKSLIHDLNRKLRALDEGGPSIAVSDGNYRLVIPSNEGSDADHKGEDNSRAPESESEPGDLVSQKIAPSLVPHRDKFLRAALILIGLGCLVILVVLHRKTRPSIVFDPPRQLTHTGNRKYSPVLTDGVRVFFTETNGGAYRVGETSLGGGEVTYLKTTIKNPYACDLSPNGEYLLIRSVVGSFDDYGPLWILPLFGGRSTQVFKEALDGSWSPDSKLIAVAHDHELWTVPIPPGTAKQIANIPGFIWWPRWSHDGSRIRFSVTDATSQLNSIWEVPLDGNGPRAVLPGQTDFVSVCCGNWTRNGASYLFQATNGRSSSVWAIADDPLFVLIHGLRPTKIAGDSLSFAGPVQDKRTSMILMRGQLMRTEPLVFDRDSGTFKAIGSTELSPATYSLSHDGKLLATISLPDETLWISSADGTNRHQLTFPPSRAADPVWAPDDKSLAFVVNHPTDHWRIATADLSSGEVRTITSEAKNEFDLSWAPEGSDLVFGHIPTLDGAGEGLASVNVQSGMITTIPESNRFFSPDLSSDGRFIVALQKKTFFPFLYDKRRQRWKRLSTTRVGFPHWLRDSRHLIFLDPDATSIRFIEMDSVSGFTSAIAPAEMPGHSRFRQWLGVDGSDRPLLVEDDSINEVFAVSPTRSTGGDSKH